VPRLSVFRDGGDSIDSDLVRTRLGAERTRSRDNLAGSCRKRNRVQRRKKELQNCLMMINDLLNELAQLYDDSDKETNFRSRLTITADETHAYRTECLRVLHLVPSSPSTHTLHGSLRRKDR